MKERVRGDKRRWCSVGLIIERVGGRGEPCWSDRSAELKPSSGLPSCPGDVKASAPEGVKRDAPRMLSTQGCLWNGQHITKVQLLSPELISMIITRARAVWSVPSFSEEIYFCCHFYCNHAEYYLCKHIKMAFLLLPVQQNPCNKHSHLYNAALKCHFSCLALKINLIDWVALVCWPTHALQSANINK